MTIDFFFLLTFTLVVTSAALQTYLLTTRLTGKRLNSPNRERLESIGTVLLLVTWLLLLFNDFNEPAQTAVQGLSTCV